MTLPGGNEIANLLRPLLMVAAFLAALYGYQKITNESLPETFRAIIGEVGKLIKREKGPHATNALLLILVFLLMVAIVVTPLKDVFLAAVVNGEKTETNLSELAATGFFVLAFFGMGLICVRMCKFYDGN